MKPFLFVVVAALSLVACTTSSKSTGSVEQVPQVIAGNEMAAMSRLRSIVNAELSYSMESGGEYAALDALIQKGLMRDPADGKLTGYRFDVKVKPGGFEATAVPEHFAVTGRRSFFVDETRQLRGGDKGGARATASDPDV